MSLEEQRCRVCGCTDDDGCENVCSWVEDDLCSSCQVFTRKSGRITYYDLPVVVDGAIFDLTFSRPQLQKVINEQNIRSTNSDIRVSAAYRGKVRL